MLPLSCTLSSDWLRASSRLQSSAVIGRRWLAEEQREEEKEEGDALQGWERSPLSICEPQTLDEHRKREI